MAGGYKSCRYLQSAIDKYGKNNFRYEVLTITHTQEVADYWEIYFIDHYDSRNHNVGYNLRGGGSRGKFHHTEKTKRKISETKKGTKLSEEHKQKIAAQMMGPLNHNFGKPKTAESLAKQSAAMSGKKHPGYGKRRSDTTKNKIAQAQSGEKSSKAKLTKDNVIEIIRLLKLGYSQRKIAKMFHVTRTTISKIQTGQSWKEIER
jgi:group I intron endonuclease